MDGSGKQVQPDSADEEIVARVAAIDVAKDSGMVCTRIPHPSSPRRRATTVWSVPARTSAIMNLAEQLYNPIVRAMRDAPFPIIASVNRRVDHEAVRNAFASKPIRNSDQVSTATERLNVSNRPFSGMFARMTAGLLTAASCCWMMRSARRMNAALSSAAFRSMSCLASCCV